MFATRLKGWHFLQFVLRIWTGSPLFASSRAWLDGLAGVPFRGFRSDWWPRILQWFSLRQLDRSSLSQMSHRGCTGVALGVLGSCVACCWSGLPGGLCLTAACLTAAVYSPSVVSAAIIEVRSLSILALGTYL